MSTGYLVLELGYPFVSRDGCCTEDLNHSRTFGIAEGIAAPIPNLGKDPAKHDLAGVVVAWAVWCLGGHNGVSDKGGGPWNHSTGWADCAKEIGQGFRWGLGIFTSLACSQKKRPDGPLGNSEWETVRFIFPLRFRMLGPLNP